MLIRLIRLVSFGDNHQSFMAAVLCVETKSVILSLVNFTGKSEQSIRYPRLLKN